MVKGKPKSNYYRIGSLEKGVNLPRILAAGGAMSLEAIAAEARMDRSGCHRYRLTFRDLGLVAKNGAAGYRLTTGLFEIAMRYTNRLELRQIARPFMEEIARKYSETVNPALRNGNHVVFLYKLEGGHQYRADIAVGTRHPVYCTAQGNAIIAFRPEHAREAYCATMIDLQAFAANTITPEAFREEIAAIRRAPPAIQHRAHPTQRRST